MLSPDARSHQGAGGGGEKKETEVRGEEGDHERGMTAIPTTRLGEEREARHSQSMSGRSVSHSSFSTRSKKVDTRSHSTRVSFIHPFTHPSIYSNQNDDGTFEFPL
mmetsp:Transcript_13615/g.27040  ORF Transcript_13615/g.27040 Transcript_13615/m.27040 type:complete len:106 (+) Transcript_13615:2327-2644(+)